VETVGFDCGQRHRVELGCRARLRAGLKTLNVDWAAKLADDHTIDPAALGEVSNTALTRDVAIEIGDSGLPNTFIPGRNLFFLTFAAALAYRRGLRHIVGGMCETDYSGYPDCRDDTIEAFQIALNLGMERRFVLHTALMWIDKAETWGLARNLGGERLASLSSLRRLILVNWTSESGDMNGVVDAASVSPAASERRATRSIARRSNLGPRGRSPMRSAEQRRHLKGALFFLSFTACVPAANWLIYIVDTTWVANGPCLIACGTRRHSAKRCPHDRARVGPARPGSSSAGLGWAIIAIFVGAALSALFAPLALVFPSATAFLFFEFADLAVYAPVQRRRMVAAVLANGIVGLVIDSVVFLWLAFGSLEFLAGQVIGRALMILLRLPVIVWLRNRDARLGIQPV